MSETPAEHPVQSGRRRLTIVRCAVGVVLLLAFLVLQWVTTTWSSTHYVVQVSGWPATYSIHEQTFGFTYGDLSERVRFLKHEKRKIDSVALALNGVFVVSAGVVLGVLGGALYRRQFTLLGMFLVMISIALAIRTYQAAQVQNREAEVMEVMVRISAALENRE